LFTIILYRKVYLAEGTFTFYTQKNFSGPNTSLETRNHTFFKNIFSLFRTDTPLNLLKNTSFLIKRAVLHPAAFSVVGGISTILDPKELGPKSLIDLDCWACITFVIDGRAEVEKSKGECLP